MIEIDISRDDLFDELGKKRLHESYMRDEETSPQERYKYVSEKFSSDEEHAQRLYDYSSKHWLSYSTPILSYGKTKNGLPISCFLNFLDDSKEGLVNSLSETNWLSMLGGGVGIGVGIRSADDLSVGIMPHLKIYEASSHAYRQGKSRRGSYATYLDINHPDIMMFVEMRKATGDPRVRTPDLHHGINITDDFMKIIERCMVEPDYDDTWVLRDPNGKEKGSVSAKELWQKILETRMLTGEPYLHFIDTANHHLPKWLKDKGLKIRQSNLCVAGDTEITILIDTGAVINVPIKKIGKFLEEGPLKVFSYNIHTEVFEFQKITKFALMNNSAKVMKITAPNGRNIICTPNHKIYTKNRNYVLASELKETDELLMENKNYNHFYQKEYLDEEIPVYDITVEGNHNFFANGILVHNCSEIELPTDKYRTAVCCLSSLNLDYYDEWKDNDQFHYDVLSMLDNVLNVFIEEAPQSIQRAIYSATMERSVGVGALGFHSLLQKKNIAFESLEAIDLNNRIFHGISRRLNDANKRLGIERGEAPDAVGTGYRLSHVLAVAPNASTSIIHGNTSPSIEPFAANAYRQDTLSGASFNRNKNLIKLLNEKYSHENLDETWSSIISNNGSVQHIPFLSKHEKMVFKTADEIDQKWIILLASSRQRFIDQGQSVNLFFKPDVNIKYLHDTHFLAWKSGMKALYYCRSERINKHGDISAQIERNIIDEIIDIDTNADECLACQ